MVINGYDYKFAYTVGAFLAIGDLDIDKKSKNANQKTVMYSAVIMSKEYEDREKLRDPEYTKRYLTLEEVKALTVTDFMKLSKEIDEAYLEGTKITVETEQPKK